MPIEKQLKAKLLHLSEGDDLITHNVNKNKETRNKNIY